MRLKQTVLILILICQASLARVAGVLPTTNQPSPITHEEQVIRTTYAKLSYADEIRIIMETMQKSPDRWKADERSADKALASRLDFKLSDFQSGPVSDINGRIMSEFAGLPSEGDTQGVLRNTPGTFNYTDSSGQQPGTHGPTEWTVYVNVAWDTTPQQRWPADGWPMAALLDLPEMGGPFDRYATYTVTVTFHSKSRTYHTAALFGKNADGSDKVHFLDLISGGSGAMTLDLLAKTEMSTAPFSKTHLRNVPFVRKWLNDNQQSCRAKGGHGDVCCNTNTNHCGIGATPISSRHTQPKTYLVMAGFHPNELPVLHPMLQSTCSSFNFETFYNHGNGDAVGHTDGQHTFTSTVDGSCTYSAPAGVTGPGPCNVQCNANANGTPADFGTLSSSFSHHVPGIASKSGQVGGNQTGQCQGTNAISFEDCLTSTCTVTVSISGSADGVGATITFSNKAIWNDQQQAVHNCQARSTTATPTPTPPPPPPPAPTPTPCDPDAPPDLRFGHTDGESGNPCASPIIIDLTGDGFALTDAAHGVMFDIAGTGVPVQIAWTANANNAFLVLDRTGDGQITNGTEMFGNFTSQNLSPHPNGFIALAVYDDPMNGGNGDGIIDTRDAIWSKLRLWVDANHDGISQPGELHTLPEMGVFSISLDYSLSKRRDEFGNVFRYRGRINQDQHGDFDVGKNIYDVFLVTQ